MGRQPVMSDQLRGCVLLPGKNVHALRDYADRFQRLGHGALSLTADPLGNSRLPQSVYEALQLAGDGHMVNRNGIDDGVCSRS